MPGVSSTSQREKRATAFVPGGAQARLLRTEKHVQLNDIVNWSAGKHLLKFGINVPDRSRRGSDDQNNFGGKPLPALGGDRIVAKWSAEIRPVADTPWRLDRVRGGSKA